MRLSAALFALLTTSPALNGQATQPLRPTDFVVGGLDLGADSAAVLKLLGDPDSTRTDPGFGVDEHALLSWYFPVATVSFFATPRRVEGIAVLSPHLATARGLRVGDTRARVRKLYGAALNSGSGDLWVYGDDLVAPRRVIVIRFAREKVLFIHVRHFRA
jgi:hypothetical protein